MSNRADDTRAIPRFPSVAFNFTGFLGLGAKVGAMTLVTKDVADGGTAVGNPQRDHKLHFRAHAVINKLATKNKSKTEIEG